MQKHSRKGLCQYSGLTPFGGNRGHTRLSNKALRHGSSFYRGCVARVRTAVLPSNWHYVVLWTFLLRAASSASVLSYVITGEVCVTNYSQQGRVVGNRSAQFELKRDGKHWAVSAKDRETGYVAEAAFDGDATYCLFRNLEVRTNLYGSVIPWTLPSHFENGRLHSGVANASILRTEQPACFDVYVQAVWLGCIPNGVNVRNWQDPVVVPWSATLPAGISLFGAKPKWSETSQVFPRELELTAVEQSSQTEIGGRKFTFDGLNGMPTRLNPFPLGALVGRMEVLSWTNIGGVDALPVSWRIRRFWLGKEAGLAASQEEYHVRGRDVRLDVPHIMAPIPSLLTHTVDSRMQTGGIPIAISYSLSNSGWLIKDDPRLASMLGRQADEYLRSLQWRASSSSMEMKSGGHSTGRKGWIRLGMITAALGPLLVLVFLVLRRRHHGHPSLPST
jgi:hypothetical protein